MVPEGKVRIHELWKWLENAGNYGNTDFCSILRWVVGLYSKSSILFGVYVGTGRYMRVHVGLEDNLDFCSLGTLCLAF